MAHVKFTGDYAAFITGRDVDSALHYHDGSDKTCVGIVETPRAGDVAIAQAEYDTLRATIKAYNDALPKPVAAAALDPDAELAAAIKAASTLDDLKRALTGGSSPFAVRGRGVKSS